MPLLKNYMTKYLSEAEKEKADILEQTARELITISKKLDDIIVTLKSKEEQWGYKIESIVLKLKDANQNRLLPAIDVLSSYFR